MLQHTLSIGLSEENFSHTDKPSFRHFAGLLKVWHRRPQDRNVTFTGRSVGNCDARTRKHSNQDAVTGYREKRPDGAAKYPSCTNIFHTKSVDMCLWFI